MFINGGFRWRYKSRYFRRFALAVGITRLKGNVVCLLIYQGLNWQCTTVLYRQYYTLIGNYFTWTHGSVYCHDPFCYEQPQFFSILKLSFPTCTDGYRAYLALKKKQNVAYKDELKIQQPDMGFIVCVRFAVRAVLLARGRCHKCEEHFFLWNLPWGHRSMENTEGILGCFQN